MNSIEEQLWDYIDGNCTPARYEQITALIANDAEYRQHYEALMELNKEFNTAELDEPPMAFTYNVMEQIRTQEALVPLRAGINRHIIYGIAAFFVLTILAILIFAFRDINWTGSPATAKITVQLNTLAYKSIFTGAWMKGFLFFDVILGLFVLDTYLRRRINYQTKA